MMPTAFDKNDDSIRPTRFRYVVIAALLAATVMNFADRGALSFASAHIIEEYDLNKSDWGAVLGFFGYGYIVGGLAAGMLSDRWGARSVWIFAGLAWSICEIITAFAGDIGLHAFNGSALLGFAAIRILFGAAEGPAFVLLNKSVAYWATPMERALMSSLVLVSAPIGALISAPLSVALMLSMDSWRAMFVLLGLLSLLTIAFLAIVFTNDPRENRNVNAAELALIVGDARKMPPSQCGRDIGLSERFDLHFLLNSVGFFSSLSVTFLVLTWIPKYLQDQHHFSLSSMSYIGMIPWVGACFSVLAGGIISDKLMIKTSNRSLARSWFAGVSLLLVSACFLSIPLASSSSLVLVLVAAANALNQLPNSVFWVIVVERSPRHLLGRFSGITLLIASSSSIFAPTLAGMIVQRLGYDWLFLSIAIVTFIGSLAMFCLRLSPEQDSRLARRQLSRSRQ